MVPRVAEKLSRSVITGSVVRLDQSPPPDRSPPGPRGGAHRPGAQKSLAPRLAVLAAVHPDHFNQLHRLRAAPAHLAVAVTGTFTAPDAGEGRLVGTFNIQRFERRGDGVVAIGTLVGRLEDASGRVIRNIVRAELAWPLALPAPAAAARQPSVALICDVLNLDLGPLDLDLLGLVIHLDRVVLDILADAVPGNLVGNLLCTIVNLLNGLGAIGSLSQLVALLNLLLSVLG